MRTAHQLANKSVAFGAPEINPRWTSSAKDGIGTAYHTSSRLWFTLSHGGVNEDYYPHVDTPDTRDLQFLITDGETFCHEERRDMPGWRFLWKTLTSCGSGGWISKGERINKHDLCWTLCH